MSPISDPKPSVPPTEASIPTESKNALWHEQVLLWWQPFARDYGMLFVLLGLGALFSILTHTEQHPTGADAGQQVARSILQEQGTAAQVLIVARQTAEDLEFTTTLSSRLDVEGAKVLRVINGDPAATRLAIQELIASNQLPSALAVNDVSSRWGVFGQFEETRNLPAYKPQPYYWPNFLKRTNLLGVANQTAVYAIIAVGMTLVILTAGIDLSVGSLVALSAVISAVYLRDFQGGAAAGIVAVLIGIALALLTCMIVGAFNGIMVTIFGLPPFIVTLGVMLMASGLAFRLAGGASIPELPSSFFWLGGASTYGIPNPVLLMALLYGIAYVVMSRTVYGRYLYAIGSNHEAARLSGVPVVPCVISVYVISGCLAGLGGLILSSNLQAGDPKFGLMYELEVIASVVVGGTSLLGGRGKVLGTLIGAFIIAVIKNGMNLTNIDPFNQKIVLGAVLLTAVGIDTLKRNRPQAFRRAMVT
ncbi:MAG: ABC transporter permease [Planctomycetaceae bacterium]|nr:ABC transporter permease [Planctomycetaceae bacterium]